MRVSVLFVFASLLALPAQARIGEEPLPAWAQPEGSEPVRVGEVYFEGADASGAVTQAAEKGHPAHAPLVLEGAKKINLGRR